MGSGFENATREKVLPDYPKTFVRETLLTKAHTDDVASQRSMSGAHEKRKGKSKTLHELRHQSGLNLGLLTRGKGSEGSLCA